jgi:hypothetical protein
MLTHRCHQSGGVLYRRARSALADLLFTSCLFKAISDIYWLSVEAAFADYFMLGAL